MRAPTRSSHGMLEANVLDCGDSVLGVTATPSSVSATNAPKKDMFFVRQTQEEEKRSKDLVSDRLFINCCVLSATERYSVLPINREKSLN